MWQPDIVQVEYHVMGQYLPALTTCPAPRVLTEHEPGVRAAPYVQQYYPGLTRVLHYFDTLAWRRFERALIREVQAVVVFTEADRQAVARLTRRTPLVRIPLGTALPKDPLDPCGRPPLSLLFVGNFLHPPNVDAAVRLGGTIFPRLRARFPELMLYLVGDHPPPQIRRVADEKIIVTGCVPDVIPYLDRAALVVVPLRLGGGMRVKVLEALAAGKAVVASPLASEGLNLVNGEQILLAENDQQFCDAITRLLADPKERASLGAHARAWACANLDWEGSLAAYEALYDGLIEHSRAMQQTG
jgi:glycosyltransferase involved in cell wall biosynthesis